MAEVSDLDLAVRNLDFTPVVARGKWAYEDLQ
jgi:hypothetical protein